MSHCDTLGKYWVVHCNIEILIESIFPIFLQFRHEFLESDDYGVNAFRSVQNRSVRFSLILIHKNIYSIYMYTLFYIWRIRMKLHTKCSLLFLARIHLRRRCIRVLDRVCFGLQLVIQFMRKKSLSFQQTLRCIVYKAYVLKKIKQIQWKIIDFRMSYFPKK